MRYAIGIDLGGTNIKSGVVDNTGKIIYKKKITTTAFLGKEVLIQQIKELICKILTNSKVKNKKIKGIGLGTPGIVDKEKGIVLGDAANIPGWKGVNIKKELEEFKLKVYVDNDAKLVTLGEKEFGVARGVKNCICITLGTGIGGGIIINGSLYRGRNFYAGDIGHSIIDLNGKQCNCGSFGCVEAYGAKTGIVSLAKQLIKKGFKTTILKKAKNKTENITPYLIAQAAKEGDKIAKEIFDEVTKYLSIGLINVIHILNPEMIVIGGGIAEAKEILFKPLIKNIKKYSPSSVVFKNLKIVKAKLGDKAGIIGAAVLVFNEEKNV